jgi:hypothetical protein
LTSYLYNAFKKVMMENLPVDLVEVKGIRPKPRWLPRRVWRKIVNRVVEWEDVTIKIVLRSDDDEEN